ncbi:MAG: hypothetical protein KC657_31705 [Myxococcales bacterium]|nr:hypothetical protein [Myxococcales bacterium]
MTAGRASLAALVLAACTRGEPPTFDAGPGASPSVAPLPPPPGAAVAPASGAPAGATPAPSATVDPGTLAQTDAKPSNDDDTFKRRMETLWDAVVHDEPERALPAFFPRTAYEQVKAVGNPEADWRRRLVGAYRRDIHALHKRLGSHAADAKLLGVEVPPDRARWVEPGEEYNKLGYWRVYGTRVRYEVEGRERSFPVSSLISWRGEWYVVHLTGFK